MLRPELTEEKLMHWMLLCEGVVYSVVKDNPANVMVSDVCPFYELSSSILGDKKHTLLKAAHSYWNMATTMPLHKLRYDALIYANWRLPMAT